MWLDTRYEGYNLRVTGISEFSSELQILATSHLTLPLAA